MDKISIERLWRSLKYEAVYLHELSDGFQAQRVIALWMEFYNKGLTPPWVAPPPPRAYQKGSLVERQTEPYRSPAPSPVQPKHENVLHETLAA